MERADAGGLESVETSGLECVAASEGLGMPAARAVVSVVSTTLDTNPLCCATGPVNHKYVHIHLIFILQYIVLFCTFTSDKFTVCTLISI